MPYIDLDNSEIGVDGSGFDVTIVGAGAAGILLAVKLSEKGKKVLLIESGHFEEDEKRQVLNEVVQTGKTLNSSVWGRKRAVGGTTIAWGGQSLPFGNLDFEKRDWVNASGWPLPYADVAKYYKAANAFMNIDALDYDADILALLKHQKPDFNTDEISYHFSKWAPEPDFRKMYDSRLQANVTVVYNAVVTDIQTMDAKAVSITVKNYNSVAYEIPVSKLILATGTIEAVRTLLLNDLGNHSGMLGKYFMEHPCINAGDVTAKSQYRLQKQFNTHIHNGRKYSIRLSLSPEAQKQRALLNASGGVMFYYPEDIPDPYVEVRRVIGQKRIGGIGGMLSNLPAYFLSAKAYLLDKLVYKHNAKGKLVLMLEQEPLEASRITLSNETDSFGLRKANINWSISRKTWEAALYLSVKIRDEFRRLSLGEVHLHSYVRRDNENWADELSDVNHHMGGTRMSSSPSDGVVDTDLKVWGYDNIYVCSCSVFPTVSHSNPTLTLLALASRLTDKLA